MAEKRAPAAPKGLGPAGRALWRDVSTEFELRADEVRIFERACRCLDLVVRLEDEVAALETLTVSGGRGQPVTHPSIDALRGERALLARLLRQLEIPDERPVDGPGRSSASARELAMHRWRSR